MPQTKQEKRTAAEARQVEYDKLTLDEKLEQALIYGSETSKQAVKLRKKIEKVQEQKKDTNLRIANRTLNQGPREE